jgi:hypothetical protein
MQNSLNPRKIAAAVLVAALIAPPATAGVRAVFADGFESGDTAVWERPTRYVVFEGFYVPT